MKIPSILNQKIHTFNGPYNDEETPIRFYSHYLSSLKKIDKDELKVIEHFITLIDSNLNIHGLPVMRIVDNKDSHNGMVGPAWILQAINNINLLYKKHAYEGGDDICKRINKIGYSLYKKVSELYNLSFNKKNYNFKLIENTMNHKLWLLVEFYIFIHNYPAKKSEKKESRNFIINFISNEIKLNIKGAFNHHLKRFLFKEFIKRLINPIYSRNMFYKEFSYHYFSLASLSRLYSYTKDDHIKKILEKIFNGAFKLYKSNYFWNIVSDSKYGIIYNPIPSEISSISRRFKISVNNEEIIYLNYLDSLYKYYLQIDNKKIKKWDRLNLYYRALSE